MIAARRRAHGRIELHPGADRPKVDALMTESTRQPPPPPVPSEDGRLSTQAKMSLASLAMALRDEQLEARIVHYKEELQTNAELDAITAAVVAELQAMQRAAVEQRRSEEANVDRGQVEIELIGNLKEMFGRLFRKDRLAVVFQRKLAEVSKRFARVFFKSELHEKIHGNSDEAKVMRFGEQALYRALTAHEAILQVQLKGFQYDKKETLAKAQTLLADALKELKNDYLSRTTPELNDLVTMLNEILRDFLQNELPPQVGELAWEVVKEARLADATGVHAYKVPEKHFAKFRQAFERRFLQRLVPFTADAMLAKVRAKEGKFRAETIRFVAEPRIYSDVCEVIADAVYDQLYNDGFLDLPGDWKAAIAGGL